VKVNCDQRIKIREGTFEPFPYSEGDVYLYPSKLDGIGLTLPEALASGLPAVTTNNPPMNEFVIEGINGLLINVTNYLGREDGYYWAESQVDIDHLTYQMQNIVEKGHQFLNELKKSTLDYAQTHLCWENNAKGLDNIFKTAINNKKAINEDLALYAFNLDKIMSPTFPQRITAIIKAFFVYVMNLCKL